MATTHLAAVPETPAVLPLPWFRVLGTRVNPVSLEAAVTCIDAWIAEGRRGRFVVASGMHAVMEGWRDAAVRRIVNSADLFVLDGFSLVWLARRRGYRMERRVCGLDLLHACCARAAARGYRMYFFGDTEAVLGALTARLTALYPGLQVAGTCSPPFRALSPEEDAALLRRVADAKPDIVWVGLGLPKQERWIVRARERVDAPVFIGVGAAFKFASGHVARAPAWVGEHGLEWLWRVVQEPRRLWRRALIDVPVFIALLALEAVGLRCKPEGGGLLPSCGRPGRRAAKRAFDIVLAGIGLLASLPLWAVIAAAIKLHDGGPVFYRQPRVGRDGRRFLSIKFRTMDPDSDRRFGIRQAAADDPRVTPVGRLLRATAMDELPQLWSIFTGDMSFVGPRALAPAEIEDDAVGLVPVEAIPGYDLRQRVRPGLTGVAQVYAPRDVPRRHKFRYDRVYVARSPFWRHLRLIALSFWITAMARWESRTDKVGRRAQRSAASKAAALAVGLAVAAAAWISPAGHGAVYIAEARVDVGFEDQLNLAVQWLERPETTRDIIDRLGLRSTPDRLLTRVRVTINGPRCIITYRGTDPVESRRTAEAFAGHAVLAYRAWLGKAQLSLAQQRTAVGYHSFFPGEFGEWLPPQVRVTWPIAWRPSGPYTSEASQRMWFWALDRAHQQLMVFEPMLASVQVRPASPWPATPRRAAVSVMAGVFATVLVLAWWTPRAALTDRTGHAG